MDFVNEDQEIDAMGKCTIAISKLDVKGKLRVIKYLIDRFELKEESNPHIITHNEIESKKIPEYVPSFDKNDIKTEIEAEDPIYLENIVMKDLPKSAPELVLITCFKNSKSGKESFSRQSILDTFHADNIWTRERSKSLTNDLHSLLKKDFIKKITNDKYSITEDGCKYAKEILSGNSTFIKRKTSIKKGRTAKNTKSSIEI